MLSDIPDETQVMVPLNAGNGFDGQWFSPCIVESGKVKFDLEDLDDEEIKERELLNQPVKQEDSFILVPCGFSKEHEGPDPAMN